MKKLTIYIAVLFFTLFLLPQNVFAATSQKPLGGGTCASTELDTAIGCIPIDSRENLIGFILKWALGIAGGIAFILIIIAGFQLTTSAGDPKKIQAAQELIGSAVGGIILLIFSVFILKFIGVDILKLPGF